MQQVISPRGVITRSILHGGVIWIFQNGGQKFYIKSSIYHIFRSNQFSLLMYRLLPSSVTVKLNYEENMENVRYATPL